MYRGTVCDVNGNGTVSLVLDDGEIFDVMTNEPAQVGDDVYFTPSQIVSNGLYGQYGNIYDDEPNDEPNDERPTIDFENL